MTKLDRKKHFTLIFKHKNIKLKDVADAIGIKPDSLYRKIAGRNSFSEKDIKIILNLLNMKFEDVFI